MGGAIWEALDKDPARRLTYQLQRRFQFLWRSARNEDNNFLFVYVPKVNPLVYYVIKYYNFFFSLSFSFSLFLSHSSSSNARPPPTSFLLSKNVFLSFLSFSIVFAPSFFSRVLYLPVVPTPYPCNNTASVLSRVFCETTHGYLAGTCAQGVLQNAFDTSAGDKESL